MILVQRAMYRLPRHPWAVLRELPMASLSVLCLLLAMALLAPLISPHDPLAVHLTERLAPPVFAGGTWSHPLGVDAVGRDILSRIIFGARIDLPLAAATLVLGGVIGTAVGMVSGYVGGWVDELLMRITDLTISYPMILLAVLLAVVLGPHTSNVVIAVAAIMWARFARVVRGDVLSIRERDYVALARVAGTSGSKILVRHILPNVINTVVVLASLQAGWVIIVEASLSFLGAGVPPPQPAWGSMIAEGMNYLTTAWWVSTMPGLAIVASVLSLNLFGDWLRDRLDPSLSQI
jgi:peptide/nickel transport system permease protein